MIGLAHAMGRAALLWTVVAVLALIGFTAMHGITVTDATASRHIAPAAAITALDAARGTTAGAPAGHVGGAAQTRPESPAGSGEHTHDDALLGCLIALTGLALTALAKGPVRSWVRERPRPLAVLLDGWATAAGGPPPGLAQLRLGVLRI